MQDLSILVAIVFLCAIAYFLGQGRSLSLVDGAASKLHSLPRYHGYYVALWCGIPAFVVMSLWMIFEPLILEWMVVSALPPKRVAELTAAELNLTVNNIRNLASGGIASESGEAIRDVVDRYKLWGEISFAARAVLVLVLAFLGLLFGRRLIEPAMRARNIIESAVRLVMIICATLAILTTIGIVLSLLFESLRFFAKVPVTEFLFGLEWSPQMAIREDQVGSSGAFGAIPLLTGTLLITFIAMMVAVPVGLFSAIFTAEYAPRKVRDAVKPILEILAGIPTVVYGFFAALTVAPFLRDSGASLGLSVSSESALAAGGVMGIMIIPFVSSLSDDVITAVPQSLRDGSYGLGATKSETIRRVVLPAALPGIVSGVLLAVSRAIGETMIVVMAAGLAAKLTANPLEAVTTLTVQIVTLLVGDQEFDSAKTLAAFALGLLLFCVTLGLNVIALKVVRKYREQYD